MAACHLALLQEQDVQSHDSSAACVRRVGTRILTELTGLAGAVERRSSVAASLRVGWGLGARRAERALDAALILCADHELNVSAFTARAIASAGATPYMAVSGALAAFSGDRHGGVAEQVLALLDERCAPDRSVGERLRRGESIPGFGHALYPDGDPRARRLLELCPQGAERTHAMSVAAFVESSTGSQPNLDFGLAALCRSLGLPRHAPFVLFALGRTAGWVAHIIEQYRTGELIRPRARYVGLTPGSPGRGSSGLGRASGD
jgi:citrate synthase